CGIPAALSITISARCRSRTATVVALIRRSNSRLSAASNTILLRTTASPKNGIAAASTKARILSSYFRDAILVRDSRGGGADGHPDSGGARLHCVSRLGANAASEILGVAHCDHLCAHAAWPRPRARSPRLASSDLRLVHRRLHDKGPEGRQG